MCWGRQSRVGPGLNAPTAHLWGGLCLAPTKQTNREMCPTCPTTRLVIVGGEWAQPAPRQLTPRRNAPQSLSVHADHAEHAVADAEHPRLSSLALEARLGPTSATLRSAHKQSSAMCSEVVLVARPEVVAVCAAGVGRSPKVVPKWCQSCGALYGRPCWSLAPKSSARPPARPPAAPARSAWIQRVRAARASSDACFCACA